MAHTIVEDSPNTISGSFTKDLIFSKLWLCRKIGDSMRKLGIDQFGSIVVLGSWYGNIGHLLKMEPISFGRLVMIDKDHRCVDFSRMMFSDLGDRFTARAMDANDLDYSRFQSPLLVINTSCNDMQDLGWYDNIPSGSMVALQSRSDHEDLTSMDDRYPMSRCLYLGSRTFEDPTEKYKRFSKIGLK